MGKLLRIKTWFNAVYLPDGNVYQSGQTAKLTDAQYDRITDASARAVDIIGNWTEPTPDTSTPTVVQGPKGDKGDKGDTGVAGPTKQLIIHRALITLPLLTINVPFPLTATWSGPFPTADYSVEWVMGPGLIGKASVVETARTVSTISFNVISNTSVALGTTLDITGYTYS